MRPRLLLLIIAATFVAVPARAADEGTLRDRIHSGRTHERALAGAAAHLGQLERATAREVGMLRAVGMTRRQTRRMVRHEGIVTAQIGAVTGMAIGVLLGGAVTLAMRGIGMTLTIPVGSLIAFAVVATVAGMLAAALPARRAARMPVLDALAYE